MAKEWILNSVLNRFQLNFKRNVGAVSEEIRKCSPKKNEFGGNVFYIFSIKEGKNKKIYNTEVIDQIRAEIIRLSK
ncbi:MAG: MjaI family restriction endonuclease [Desulfamplus sp.]